MSGSVLQLLVVVVVVVVNVVVVASFLYCDCASQSTISFLPLPPPILIASAFTTALHIFQSDALSFSMTVCLFVGLSL